jgi:hypothetical protein
MPRAPSRQQEIENELVGVAAVMSQAERDTCRVHGRTMAMHAAVDYAVGLCAVAR